MDKFKNIPADAKTCAIALGQEFASAFAGSTFSALGVAILLNYDKYQLYFRDYKKADGEKAKSKQRHWLRAVHAGESTLHVLSDNQLVTGIALLAALSKQACTISAYHYNIVCNMLLLGAVTHLQIALSCMVLSGRNVPAFPANASPMAIMPAACFESKNASQSFGLLDAGDFVQNITSVNTTNSTAWLGNANAATNKTSGYPQYLILVAFIALSLLLLIFEWLEKWIVGCLSNRKKTPHQLRWLTTILCSLVLAAILVIAIITLVGNLNLRAAMEVEAWFKVADDQEGTYGQMISVFLFGSTLLTIMKAFRESFPGRGARFAEHVAKETQVAGNAANKSGPDPSPGV